MLQTSINAHRHPNKVVTTSNADPDVRIPNKLRVALITETFLPEINGVAMTLGRLVGGMRANGHRVTVVRPRQNHDGRAEAGQLLRCGLPIPGYPQLRFGLPSGLRLRSAWRQDRPDVVHIATEGPLGQSAMYAARELGIPITTSFHTNFHQYSSHYSMGFLQPTVAAYLRRFHNRATYTMVPTFTVKDQLQELGIDHLRILSRGVDSTLFNPRHRREAVRQSWGLGPNDLALLCVGRLAAEKNLDLAIRALAAVRAQRPGSKLILVGDGPEKERLGGHPGVLLTGALPSADLAAHYASADLFVFPSTTETFGNVLTEAMASGLPAVAFNYAAAAERLNDGVQGYRAPFADNAAFIERTVALSCLPEEQRQAMAAAAVATAHEWSWQRIVQQFAQTLTLAIAASKRQSRLRRRP